MFLHDVAHWIVHSPLVLEVPGSIPVAERKISVSEHAFPTVICRDDTGLVGRPSDPDVNWMSPVQGKSPLVQVKEPYGNFVLQPGVYKVHLQINACEGVTAVRQYIGEERE